MKRLSIAALVAGLLTMSASAQGLDNGAGPGVARLGLIEGDVTIRRGDSGEFIAAERNAPVVALDHVITGDDGRVEIQFDWANLLRLAPNSEVRLAALDDGDFFLQLVEGLATYSVLRESTANAEISTLTASVRPLEQGNYRVLVGADGSTQITVRSGEVEIFTARGAEFLRAGRTMQVQGNPDDPTVIVLASIPLDEWDSWNEARNRDLNRSQSYQYVSRDVYGADDLDGYGRWVYDSPYGWVWVPSVSGSWAPYRDGRWSWVNHYGWTWISSDPWGWAPYHYGRWYYASSHGWAWYPGARRSRHVWRPALVTFFGWGSARVSLSVGFGFGNVGWVPLAPYEIYRPWYGRGNRNSVVVNNVTVINNVDIGRFRNARLISGRNAVTSVTTQDFGRNRVTVNNFVRASDRELRRAGEVRGRIPIEPSREGRQFSDRRVDARNVIQRTIDEGQLARRGGNALATNNRARQRQAIENAAVTSGGQTINPGNVVSSGNNSPARADSPVQSRVGQRGEAAARDSREATNNRAQQRRIVDAPAAPGVPGVAAAPRAAEQANRSGNGIGNRTEAPARVSAPAPRRIQQQGATTPRTSPGATNNRGQQRRAIETPTAVAPAAPANNPGNGIGNRTEAPARVTATAPRRVEQATPRANSGATNNRAQQRRAIGSPATANSPQQRAEPQPRQNTAPAAERRSPAPAPQAQRAPQPRREPQTQRAPAQRAPAPAQTTREPQNNSNSSRATNNRAQQRRSLQAPAAQPRNTPAPQAQRAPEARSAPNANRGGGARSAPAPQASRGNNRSQPPSPPRGNTGQQNGRARNSAPPPEND